MVLLRLVIEGGEAEGAPYLSAEPLPHLRRRWMAGVGDATGALAAFFHKLMTSERVPTPREAMERKRTQLLEELAGVEHDIAEYDRFAAKYNFIHAPAQQTAIISPPAPVPSPTPASAPAPAAEGGLFQNPTFDGTVASLIACYKFGSLSYRGLFHVTRENYDRQFEMIARDIGAWEVSKLDHDLVQRLFEEWAGEDRQHVYKARSLVGMMRILASYGWKSLKDASCR